MKSFKRCGKDLIKKSDAVVDAVKKLKVMEEKLSSKLNITGGEGNQVVDAMQSSNSTTNESFRCNVPTNLHDQEGMDIGGHDYQPFYQHNCNESSLSDNEYRTNTSNENQQLQVMKLEQQIQVMKMYQQLKVMKMATFKTMSKTFLFKTLA